MKSLLLFTVLTISTFARANCVEVFHVHREVVGGLVDHEFIGFSFSHPGQKPQVKIFGLTKGESDRSHFQSMMSGEISTRGADRVGSVCGETEIKRAVSIASAITERLTKKHKNWFYYTGRMVVTPLVGKPCGNAADEIEVALLAEWRL